jgi:hypothetical protein
VLDETLERCESMKVRRDDGVVIGELNGNVFFKPVMGSRHLFRKLDGWAIDINALTRLAKWGVKWIEVYDMEDRHTYRVDFDTFVKIAIPINFGEHGGQLCLPRSRWQ